jgi:hypothetical protein
LARAGRQDQRRSYEPLRARPVAPVEAARTCAPQPPAVAQILALQRTAGNGAVTHLLRAPEPFGQGPGRAAAARPARRRVPGREITTTSLAGMPVGNCSRDSRAASVPSTQSIEIHSRPSNSPRSCTPTMWGCHTVAARSASLGPVTELTVRADRGGQHLQSVLARQPRFGPHRGDLRS